MNYVSKKIHYILYYQKVLETFTNKKNVVVFRSEQDRGMPKPSFNKKRSKTRENIKMKR